MSEDANRIRCSNCGQKIRYRPEHAGKKLKCPKCGTSVTLPSSSSATPVWMQPAAPMPVAGHGGGAIPSFEEERPAAEQAAAAAEPEAGGPRCGRCQRPVDPVADKYEFFAYRRTRYRFKIFGSLYFLEEQTTYEGLVQMEGHACERCVREIKAKYKKVWLGGLALLGLVILVTVLLQPKEFKAGWTEPSFLLIFGAIFVGGFILFALGFFFPFFRFCVGQRIAIAPQREILEAAGLNKIVGGRFGQQSEQQFFTRLIFK